MGEIWLVLTDDWELRGNGRGSVEALQRTPARRLMDLYESLGIRSTFNVEVMQQLAFERFAEQDPAIRAGRDAWLATVSEMLERGFDVQLHTHPQWMDAELIDGWWKLDPRWHVADYSAPDIDRMLDMAVGYLRPLLGNRRLDCYRAGAWGMGPPSRPMLEALVARGFRLDVSVVDGVKYAGNAIRLDYSRLQSPQAPYVPDYDDIRKVAKPGEGPPLVELPTQSVGRTALIGRMVSAGGLREPGLRRDLISLLASCASSPKNPLRGPMEALRAAIRPRRPQGPASSEVPAFVMTDPFGFDSRAGDSGVIVDLSSSYSPGAFRHIADLCIERARRRRDDGPRILVFENHTKDLQSDKDFERIHSLLQHIRTHHPDVAFKTLGDVAGGLEPAFPAIAGAFPAEAPAVAG